MTMIQGPKIFQNRVCLPALFFLIIVCLPVASALEGTRVGDTWTDYDGTNYRGNPSTSSSGYSSPYYSSAYGDAAGRLGEAVGQAFSQALSNMAEAQARQAQGYQLNQQGNQCFIKQNYACAVSAYEQALAYLPNDYSVLNNLKRAKAGVHYADGLNFHKEKAWEQAIASYQRALQYDSSSLAIHQNLRKAQSQQRLEHNAQKERLIQDQMAASSHEVFSQAEQMISELKRATSLDSPLSADQKPSALDQVKVPLEAFRGANRENPELFPTTKKALDPKIPEGSKNAGEQLHSTQFHGITGTGYQNPESSAEELSKGFDTGGNPHGALPAVEIKGDQMGAEAVSIPEKLQNLPGMKDLADRWNQADIQNHKAQKTLARLESKPEKTSADYVAIARARDELTKIENEKNFIRFKLREKESEKSAAPPEPKTPPAPAAPDKPAGKSKIRRIVLEE